MTKGTSPASPKALADLAKINYKPLAHNTLNDLVIGKHTTPPDAWTVSMFVLACVSWGAQHGSPILADLSEHTLNELLREWQRLRTIYEELLQHPAGRVNAPVRVGVLPMVADRFQDRDIALQLQRATQHTGAVIPTQDKRPPTGEMTRPANTTVLAGMDGVGKTQLAADLAHRIWADPQVRLGMWVSARSHTSITSAYTEAAADLLGADPTEPQRAIERLLNWMAATTERWVVILDDLQRPEDLHRLWPPTGPTGQVVVTTRRRDPSLHRTDRTILSVDVYASRITCIPDRQTR